MLTLFFTHLYVASLKYYSRKCLLTLAAVEASSS